MSKELQAARLEISHYDNKVTEMARDKDDALGKLQRTIEDYVRHCEKRQVANRA